tara:strand:- start:8 stop:880 length:873 start_codon:yes stop_codon:yes gene_type:complete
MTLATLNTANFAEMAQAMGMGADMSSASSKASTLPRLRIWNSAVMGQVVVKGKVKNMEVLPSGMYRLQLPNDSFIYAEGAELRVFVQRFMYKKYNSEERSYTKTIMAEDLKRDLKDNMGGFNCGKPAGYVEDFNALPEETKTLIRQVKRVRVLLGEVRLINPVDVEGNEIEQDVSPFIWEIDNKDAFKTMGLPFSTMGRQKRLPVQHWIKCGSEERSLPTGASFFLPTQELNLSDNIELKEEDQQTFASFMEWIGNYNQYIVNTYNEKAIPVVSQDDATLVDEFIDIDGE